MGKIATIGLYLCAVTLACTGPAFGQAREVTGTVTDAASGFPLPGVNITIDGTTTGTTTGINGAYALQVPGAEAVLVYSFVGYETQRIPVGDRSVIDVALFEDVALLEDVVVVGYGTQRREAVTGSVATVDAADANQGLVTSPDQLIQGRVAGVSIVQNSGEPGAGFNIRIRGGTSITASNEPLYVIDGVPIDNSRISPDGIGIGGDAAAARNPLNLLNPNDIASITVLKDASAAAIYGSRGANGVILITTKRGGAGTVAVDYEGYVSGSTIARKLDFMSGEDYRRFVQQNGLPTTTGPFDTSWQDEITRTAVSQFHNVSITGGAANTNYRASASFMDQEGVINSSGIERFTGRVNASHRTFGERLRFDVNLVSSFMRDDFAANEEIAGFEGGLFTNAFAYNPTMPVLAQGDYDNDQDVDPYFETGPGRTELRNPVALLEQVQDAGETTRTLGNFQAEIDLLTGLTARVNVGADRSTSTRRMYFPMVSPVGAEFGGRAAVRSRDHGSVTFNSYLTYRAQLGRQHRFDVLGAYEFNEYENQDVATESRSFRTDAFGYNRLEAGAEQVPPTSFKEQSRLISFFTRLNYEFSERYFLTGVLRYDGSSRFGVNNRWALFPSLSAAWAINREGFMRGVDYVSELRLRVGYGVVGNQEIGFYRSLATLASESGARAVIGGTPIPGIAPNVVPNENLRWEQTSSYNIGLDYGLFNGRLSGTLEYYRKDTDDLLLEVPAAQPAPRDVVVANVGSLRNQGVEFSLDALALDAPDLNLLLGLVFAANRQEVTDLGTRDYLITGRIGGPGMSDTRAQRVMLGEPLGTFFGPVYTGADSEGRPLYEDIDGDGVIEPGGDDQTIIGHAQPDFSLGLRSHLNVGRFDVSAFVRGEFGRDIFNNTALIFQTKSNARTGRNFLVDALDDPDPVDVAPFYSSRWIEDGTFVRLDNVTLGYTVDLSRLSSYARHARVYVTAQNLFVLTPYSGSDPEVNTSANLGDVSAIGIDYTTYPRPRTLTLGLQLGL